MKVRTQIGNGKWAWDTEEFPIQRGANGSRLRTMLRTFLGMSLPTDLVDEDVGGSLLALGRPSRLPRAPITFASSAIFGATMGGGGHILSWPEVPPLPTPQQEFDARRDRDQDDWPEGGLWR